MPSLSNSSRAFTLLETLVVIAISTVVVTALTALIQSFYRSNAFLLEQTAALESTRRGVREAVRSIREASYGDDGAYPITAAATSSITIYSDFDSDNSVEKVTYVLLASTLYRAVVNASGTPATYTGQPVSTSTVATYVMNGTVPVFAYFDDAGTQLSATSTEVGDVASVTITLMVDLNPNRAPNVFTLTESSTLRNLRVIE